MTGNDYANFNQSTKRPLPLKIKNSYNQLQTAVWNSFGHLRGICLCGSWYVSNITKHKCKSQSLPPSVQNKPGGLLWPSDDVHALQTRRPAVSMTFDLYHQHLITSSCRGRPIFLVSFTDTAQAVHEILWLSNWKHNAFTDTAGRRKHDNDKLT